MGTLVALSVQGHGLPLLQELWPYQCLFFSSDPACIDARFFFFACGSSDPVRVECEGGAAAWLAGTLVAPTVQGQGLPLPQELWPYQNLFSSLL